MFPKLLVIIVCVGATACALLVNRQQRIATFHEMSVIHRRLLEHERTLWQMRSEIAQKCRPTQVRVAMNRLNEQWIPIPAAPPAPTLRPGEIRLASAAKPTS